MSDSVILTLVAPRALEEKLIELLLAHETAGAAGFTVRELHGYGRSLVYTTIGEQISGRVRQVELRLVLPAGHAQEVTEHLAVALRGQNVVWQLTPLVTAGTFT